MATTQQYSLKWNNYTTHLAFHFESLRNDGDFTDVTLCCEGKKIKAHKVILSACSTYFCEVFKENPHPHPVIIFKNVKYTELVLIIQFMYNGEVSVIQDLLTSFLQTAELLQVRGLTDTNLTESAKSLVTEETRPAETLFLAVPQETNKILTALSSTPIKTVQAHVPHETYTSQTIRIEQPTTKIIEHHVKPPTLVKRLKKTHTIQATTQQVQQHQPATVQTYETLGLDNDGELMETEGEVEFLQTTGMKMEIPDFIDVPSTDATKTTTIQENPPSYIQTSDNVTYQIIDGQVVKRQTTAGGQQTTTIVQTQDVSQEQEMDEQENESGELAMYQQDDDKNAQGGATIVTSKHPDNTSNSPNSKWTKCSFCKLVITTANLWRHVRTQHTNQPKIQCEKCHKTFKNKYSLREHVRMAHENKQQGQTTQQQQAGNADESDDQQQLKVEATTVTVVAAKDA